MKGYSLVFNNKNRRMNRAHAVEGFCMLFIKFLYLWRALLKITMWCSGFLFKGPETPHLGRSEVGETVCQCPGSHSS